MAAMSENYGLSSGVGSDTAGKVHRSPFNPFPEQNLNVDMDMEEMEVQDILPPYLTSLYFLFYI